MNCVVSEIICRYHRVFKNIDLWHIRGTILIHESLGCETKTEQ